MYLCVETTAHSGWILKIGKKKDLTINLRHMMNFGKTESDINIENDGKFVHYMKVLILVASRYLNEMKQE